MPFEYHRRRSKKTTPTPPKKKKTHADAKVPRMEWQMGSKRGRKRRKVERTVFARTLCPQRNEKEDQQAILSIQSTHVKQAHKPYSIFCSSAPTHPLPPPKRGHSTGPKQQLPGVPMKTCCRQPSSLTLFVPQTGIPCVYICFQGCCSWVISHYGNYQGKSLSLYWHPACVLQKWINFFFNVMDW